MYPIVKRGMDVVGSALLLLLSSPLMGLLAVLILCQRDGPVIFAQTRPGKNGKLFRCRKLRSMRAPAYPGEPDHCRITRLGRFLRRFSLDELPQFWNILVGEMSFIGPRPLLPEYLEYYSQEQCRRHELRPGLTGWAQVNGRNAADWTGRLAMDCWYVEHSCLKLDLRIAWTTMAKLFTGEGVNRADDVTMESFCDYARQRDTEKAQNV